MKEVEGKVAFVTGGASGIGLGIARAFVDSGMKVVIAGRSGGSLREALAHFATAGQSSRVHAICVDVTDRAEMDRAAAETVDVFGKVHVLVNNAGVNTASGLSTTSYEDWDSLMGVNLDGVFNGVRAFVPRIKDHAEGGHVLATASILGLFVVGGGSSGAYCTSKFAVVGMMEALRAELAGTKIGVSVCCPGVVKTNLDAGLMESSVASDPLEVGRLVLRGMQNDDLYILTHSEFERTIRCRSELLLASIPTDVVPTDDRVSLARSLLEGSIYATEPGLL